MIHNKNNSHILLSVVIIGLNERDRIGPCIDSVKSATVDVGPVEIVYVDSGSTDNTIKIVLSKGIKVIKLGSKQPPSPSAGRYVGTVVSHGCFILFVDGDTKIASGWIKPALDMMINDKSILMFAGKLSEKQGEEEILLEEIKGLGTIKPVHNISGSWAPIVQREGLEKAGNWNPFVRCREEEDVIMRLRYYVPSCKILQSDQCTFTTPKFAIYKPVEFLNRFKSGFIKGPGQILRNAFAYGYWRLCWHIAKPILFVLVLLAGLIVSMVLNVWWQFLLIFFGLTVIRAVIRRQILGIVNIFYCMIIGGYSLWELLTVKVRTASNYVCDYENIQNS